MKKTQYITRKATMFHGMNSWINSVALGRMSASLWLQTLASTLTPLRHFCPITSMAFIEQVKCPLLHSKNLDHIERKSSMCLVRFTYLCSLIHWNINCFMHEWFGTNWIIRLARTAQIQLVNADEELPVVTGASNKGWWGYAPCSKAEVFQWARPGSTRLWP